MSYRMSYLLARRTSHDAGRQTVESVANKVLDNRLAMMDHAQA